MTDAVLLLCTAADREEARRIARALVEERLAACVQLSPIESWYSWQGAIEQSAEYRLHVKTSAARAAAVEERIRALHSYELPEIVTLPVAGGSAAYLDWVQAMVSG